MKTILYTLLLVIPLLGSAQVNQQDSLALRTVWEALDGPNWSRQWTGLARSWSGTTWNDEGRLVSVRITSERNMKGVLDPAIGLLTELTQLELGRIHLEDNLPAELNNLQLLESLVILTGQVTVDEIRPMVNLSNLTKLKLLNLFSVPSQQDVWPEWFRGLKQLENLGLRGTEVTQPIPEWFNELVNLEHLFIDDSKSTGRMPDLSNLNLVSLTFGGQNMDEQPFPVWVTEVTSLERLGLYECNLMGAVPPSISNLDKLMELRINANKLSGDLGEWADGLSPSLGILSAGRNRMKGRLQESYFNREAIRAIFIDNNELTSTDSFSWFSGNDFRISFNQIPTQYLEPVYEALNGVVNTLILDNQSYILEDTIRLVEGSQYVMASGCSGQYDRYIWYKDGEVIEDAIDANYTIESFSPSDAGVYWCEIRNDSLGDAFRTTDINVSTETVTSNEDLHGDNNIMVYPNPVSDFINIVSEDQLLSVVVRSSNGSVVIRKIFDETTRQASISLQELSTGIYFMSLFTDTGQKTTKILKE